MAGALQNGRVHGTNEAQAEKSLFSAEAVRAQKQMRWNPLNRLTPETLKRALDAFEYGDLREFVLLAEAVAERDDTVKSVKPKREKDVAHLPWQILTVDDSDEAMAHKAALEYFYNNVTAVNAYDRNERGGFSRLVRQMQSSVSYRYAVHHIVWQPDTTRPIYLDEAKTRAIAGLTATFEYCPLWFFENRTGTLRFIRDGLSVEGDTLTPGEWMVTFGDCLMTAVLIGYFMKRLSMNDWLNFSEMFGLPARLGRTSAAKDSDAGTSFRDAVESFGNDYCAIIYGDDGNGNTNKIELIQAEGGTGSLPFPALVERVDRKIASLYRGADLSTMSSKEGEGTGASLQEEESDILQRDDAQACSEALNHYVDRPVLQHQFGVSQGKAYIKIMVPEDEDADKVLSRAERLADRGAKISLSGVMERVGMPQADDADEILQPRSATKAPKEPEVHKTEKEDASNSRPGAIPQKFLGAAQTLLGAAFTNAIEPTGRAIIRVLNVPDDQFEGALLALNVELGAIARSAGADEETANAYAKILSAALFNGITHENNP